MASSRYVPDVALETAKKTHSARTEIGAELFPNTSVKVCRYTNLLDTSVVK